MRRLLIALVVALFFVGASALAWTVLGWPPPGLVLKYGLPPTGGPTGRRMLIATVEFVELGPGYFRMGAHAHCRQGDLIGRLCASLGLGGGNQPKHEGSGCPPHWVEISKPFWIACAEITNQQVDSMSLVHGRSKFSLSDRGPAIVTRDEAKELCGWLSSHGALSVRLPSEAEWEFACRSGSSATFCFGDSVAELQNYAWFSANSGGRAHDVMRLRANSWGLYDMHGNASEWCEDVYHHNYRDAPADGSVWSVGGERRDGEPLFVARGGSWFRAAVDCSSSFRESASVWGVAGGFGLRPAADLRGETCSCPDD